MRRAWPWIRRAPVLGVFVGHRPASTPSVESGECSVCEVPRPNHKEACPGDGYVDPSSPAASTESGTVPAGTVCGLCGTLAPPTFTTCVKPGCKGAWSPAPVAAALAFGVSALEKLVLAADAAPLPGDGARVPPQRGDGFRFGGFLLDEKDRWKPTEPRTSGKDFCAECDCQSAAGRGNHMTYAGGFGTDVITCAFCPHSSPPVELARAFHVVHRGTGTPKQGGKRDE